MSTAKPTYRGGHHRGGGVTVRALATLLSLALLVSCSTGNDSLDTGANAVEDAEVADAVPSNDFSGFLRVIQPLQVEGDWDSCWVTGGYSNINRSSVVIEGPDRTRLASANYRNMTQEDWGWVYEAQRIDAQLRDSEPEFESEEAFREFYSEVSHSICLMVWEMEDVPEVSNYTVVTNRGSSTYSHDEAEQRSFTDIGSIGSP